MRVFITASLLAAAALSMAQGQVQAPTKPQTPPPPVAQGSANTGHGTAMHFRFAGSDGGSMVQLAMRPDVQKELALTPDEETKIADLNDRMLTQVTSDFQKMQSDGVQDPNKMRDTISGTGNKFATELPTILTADQNKRLFELLLQRSGYSALERADVQTALGFTDDQKAKVDAAQKALLSAFDDLRTKNFNSREELQAAAKSAMDTHTDALKAILTPDQATKFDAMKGKPFTFEEAKKGAA